MSLAGAVSTKLHTVRTLAAAGMLRPTRPDRLVRSVGALARWGPTPAAGIASAAIRFPDEAAVVDERGRLSFSELHARSNALARALRERGVRAGEGVAVMCRNHRGFIETTLAASKLGANTLFLNTAFSGPQIAEVLRRESARAVVYDDEFEAVLSGAPEGLVRVLAWREQSGPSETPDIDRLVAEGSSDDLEPPAEPGRAVILTSGTTGTPKGAARAQPRSLDPAAALLSRIPLRARETTHIAAPLFHAWGFAHFMLAMGLSSTLVLRRRFDPEASLALCAEHSARALVVVPVMLQRMLELEPAILDRYELPALRAVPVSGSALPGPLALRFMERFGDVLYNLYGSTEVAWATIATPEDLRAAPGTVGRPPRGTLVRLYDDAGRPSAPGSGGRIFVGNEMLFEGYTGGGGKDEIGGLMATGDVGHFDADGRLFVDGRDDDMIVSGGENVFPGEVEEALSAHDQIAEVAVVGVPDESFGQRLKAVVVVRGEAELSAAEVKAFVKGRLASYKVPRDVEFVSELPRTSTGKVLKREL